MPFLVYVLTCKASGKSYVGYTNKATAAMRFTQHCQAATRGSPFAIHAAIRKYGVDAWTVQDLAQFVSEDDAKEWEQATIKQYRTLAPAGYNMTAGGDGFRGLVRTEQHRERIAAAYRGKPKTDAMRRKISATLSGKAGRAHTEESRASISEAQSGERHWSHGRDDNTGAPKTYIVTTPEGEVIEVTGLAKFAREHGIVSGSLFKIVDKDREHRGYRVRKKQIFDWPDIVFGPVNLTSVGRRR